MKHVDTRETIALANGQEAARFRPICSETETRGAPTNPLRPIVVVPDPAPPTPTTTTPGNKRENHAARTPDGIETGIGRVANHSSPSNFGRGTR
jgi:hypothetical protein